MPRDLKLVETAQLKVEGRFFLLICLVLGGIISGVILLGDGLPLSRIAKGLIIAICGLGVLLTGTSGIYFLLVALLRKKDWQPDFSIRHYKPKKEEKYYWNLIEKEVGEAVEISAIQEEINDIPPLDSVPGWKRFFNSTEHLFIRNVIHYKVKSIRNEFEVSILLGRGKNNPRTVLMGIEFQSLVQLNFKENLIWDGQNRFVTLQDDSNEFLTISEELRKLLKKAVRFDFFNGKSFSTDLSHFSIEPIETGCRAVLHTLPESTKGGFQMKLGVKQFMEILDAVERMGVSQ
jgi:hypothetical protein